MTAPPATAAPCRPLGGAPAWAGAAVLLAMMTAATVAALRWPVPLVAAPAPASPAAGPAAAEPAGADRAALVDFLHHNPRNGRGWVLLGLMDLEADRFDEAAAAFEKGIAASRQVAGDPAVWCWWADALGMAQGGSLAGRPTELIERALALRANHPIALEMAGSAAYERRDFERAVGYWRQLLPQIPQGSPPHQQLEAAIARAERLAATSLPPPR
jgi:cytochrome c-type biogenesis protein CcmH